MSLSDNRVPASISRRATRFGRSVVVLAAIAGCQAPSHLAEEDWTRKAFSSPRELLSKPSGLAKAANATQATEEKLTAAQADVTKDSIGIDWDRFFRPHAKPVQDEGDEDESSIDELPAPLASPSKPSPQTQAKAEDKQLGLKDESLDSDSAGMRLDRSDFGVQDFDSSMSLAGGIGLPELEQMAVDRHPSLAQFRSQVDAARGQRMQAGLPYNPTLQYQSDEIGNDDSTGIHSLQLSQRFVTGNKLALAQSVQSQQVNQAQALWQRQLLQVRVDVQVAFARALVEQQRVELSEQIRTLARQSEETASQLTEAGEVSRVALLQARVELENASLAAENAAIQYAAARRRLAATVTLDALPEGRLAGNLADDLTSAPWESLLNELLASSPELAVAGTQIHAAEQALRLACAQNIPDVTAQVGFGVDTATDDTFAVLGVSVPLPIRNRNQGNIHSARARIAAANAAVSATQFDLTRRLADAVARYRVAKRRYERLEQTVLPLAQETLSLSLEAFRGGETSYLELLTAQRSLFSTRLRSLDALADARQALAEINGQLVTIQ